MYSASLLSPRAWAKQTFGCVNLGDQRRNRRCVGIGTALMRRPSASLPLQLAAPAALKATYRLLDQEAVTFQELSTPHWEQTRQAARQQPVVLLVQDTTEFNFTHHPKTTGLGPVNDGRSQGFLLQTVLAVVPEPRQVLGIAAQEPFLRKPAARESCAQRKTRDRESEVWGRCVMAVGKPPAGVLWVHVGDRYADNFDFFAACRAQESHFLVRAAQDRCLRHADGTRGHLLSWARSLPSQAQQTLALPARSDRPAREATVQLAFGTTTLLSPQGLPPLAPLRVAVVRVWEAEPPDAVEGLEWILVTSVPTETVAQAWERVAWYRCRWLCEDYHQCLKTGCRFEERQVQTKEALFRLLGWLAPVAVRLLQLRELARLAPERVARAELPPELVQVVAALAEVDPVTLTVGGFWKAVAQLGGYLGRRRDGPPGWQTLWRGWLHVQAVFEGVQLARRLPPT